MILLRMHEWGMIFFANGFATKARRHEETRSNAADGFATNARMGNDFFLRMVRHEGSKARRNTKECSGWVFVMNARMNIEAVIFDVIFQQSIHSIQSPQLNFISNNFGQRLPVIKKFFVVLSYAIPLRTSVRFSTISLCCNNPFNKSLPTTIPLSASIFMM